MQQIVKTTKNNGILTIKQIDKSLAKEWIIKNHYSHKWNSSFGILNYGIFKNNQLMGVAVYGWMMNPSSHKKICNTGKDSIIELNRLHLSDELVKNAESTFLAATFKLIKANQPKVKFIHTFADGRLGCGTIYKATNFKYYGHHESRFFIDESTDETYHKVSFENTKRPTKFLETNRLRLDNKLKAFDVKTYRYIFSLYNNRKFKILLPEHDYPEYEIGCIPVKIHTISLPILCRLKILYEFINDFHYLEKVDNILKTYDQDIVKNELIKQYNNDSIKHVTSPTYSKLKKYPKNALF